MTVGPDEGMQLIAQRMAAHNATAAGTHADAAGDPGAPGGGTELELMAGLAVALRANTRALEAPRRRGIPWSIAHPIPLNPIASAQAGPLSDERWGPREGWAWHITAVCVVFGSGTTQATIYRDSQQAQYQRNQQSVSFLWEPRGQYLLPQQTLCFSSVGGGITVSGDAVEIDIGFLPDYIL
jgi:hypothetical protein